MMSDTTPPAYRLRRHPLKALVSLASGVLAWVSLTTVAAPTDASWTAATSARAKLTAATVPPPTASGCAGTALSTTVAIKWSLPASGGYTTADIAFGINSDGLGNLGELLGATTSATTGPVNGVYTTTLNSSLLSGVLGSLLGKTIYISLWTMYKPSSGISSNWVSTPAGYKVAYPLVLGLLGGTCSSP